ncbi:MAG TPA: hypothetical protein VM576_12605 [Xanthomonadaceae bacterium]|nr:hypothetical protein [Xanthomonadaceae bacterium]
MDNGGVWFVGLMLAFVGSMVLGLAAAIAGGVLHGRGHAVAGRRLIVAAMALGIASTGFLLAAGALFAAMSR